MKLNCQEISEIDVVSACLQDGITSLRDMVLQKSQRRFVILFSRFMWELVPKAGAGTGGSRIRCGIHFNDVLSISVQDIDQTDRTGLLALLTLKAEEKNGNIEIELIFAGRGSIKLLVECIDLQLSDQGSAWATSNRPDHQGEAAKN